MQQRTRTLSTHSATRERFATCFSGASRTAEARPKLHDGGAPCIVVVGGGATGVETAGAVVELLEASRAEVTH